MTFSVPAVEGRALCSQGAAKKMEEAGLVGG